MAQALACADDELKLLNGHDSEWDLIGELKEIVTYPIDTGFGFTSETAQVTKFGMTSMSIARMTFLPFRVYHFRMEDRSIIPIKDNSADLFGPEIAAIRHETIINELDMARRPDLLRRITYLDRPMQLCRIDTAATQHHIDMSRDITESLPCEFGYISQEDRWDIFNRLIQAPNEPDEINNGYLANYSPFMLINKTSLEAVKEETGRQDLSRSDFRPNFVIDAATPYCEENISHLKIGTEVEFHKIIPCTHTKTKITGNGVEVDQELFRILKRRHSVNVMHSRLPTFGINMQAKEVGEVAIGMKVYAKFNKSLDN